MTLNPRRAFAASLILHLMIGLVLWRRPTETAPQKTEIQIEVKEVFPRGSPASASRSAGSRGGLRKFMPGPGHFEKSGGSRDFTEYGETGLSEEEWGSHGGKFEEIQKFNQYEKLFVHLQGMLDYPSRLGMHGLSDTVNSRLVFDENSHCDWRHSHVGGAHPYFRVYTLALLKKLCAMEAIEHLRFTRGQFADISFAFVLLEGPASGDTKPLDDFIQGNILSYRRTFIHSHLEYRVGPLEGYFFAPVVNINFPWIYEHWEKWVQGKDPMREFKSNN